MLALESISVSCPRKQTQGEQMPQSVAGGIRSPHSLPRIPLPQLQSSREKLCGSRVPWQGKLNWWQCPEIGYLSQVQWQAPAVPGAQEDEAGGFLKPRSSSLAWAAEALSWGEKDREYELFKIINITGTTNSLTMTAVTVKDLEMNKKTSRGRPFLVLVTYCL